MRWRLLGLVSSGVIAAFGCSSDLIDLLPPSSDSTAGSAGTSNELPAAGSGARAGAGGTSQGGNPGVPQQGACAGDCGTDQGGGADQGGESGSEQQREDECASDQHCRDGMRCDFTRGRCTPTCETQLDCENAWGRVCDLVLGMCVDCAEDRDCASHAGPPGPRCLIGRCVECLVNEDCRDHDEPHCGALLRCRECLFDQHCEPGERCDANGRCARK
jgi:hypothetical protein